MASLQILKSSFSQLSVSHSNSPREFNSHTRSSRKVILNFQSSKFFRFRSFRVACKLQEDDSQSNIEDPPESLFKKELKRRGMTPTSFLEESNRSDYEDEMKFKEEEGGYSKRNAVVTEYEKSLSNQKEHSMAQNSEGLEGSIPWSKLLLSLGGTFFLAFWQLILITVGTFIALYLYFGPAFVHDGR